MMAYKCDRCGKLFERKCNPDVIVTRYLHGYGEMKLDMCKECHLDLLKFCRFKDLDTLIKSEDIVYEVSEISKGCTYYEHNNKKPCCTHECDGCVWYV